MVETPLYPENSHVRTLCQWLREHVATVMIRFLHGLRLKDRSEQHHTRTFVIFNDGCHLLCMSALCVLGECFPGLNMKIKEGTLVASMNLN